MIRFAVLLIIMLSAGVRAFTASAGVRQYGRTFARAMSTDGPDTSIVDICSQKIKGTYEE